MDMATSTGSSMPTSTSSSSSMAMDMEQMNMVFFTSTTTLLWTNSFAPETTGQYAGVCIFLIAFASILRMLLALRVNFYSIRDGLRRRRTKGLLVESRASDISNRPWRANEAMMLGTIDVLIAGHARSDDYECWLFPLNIGRGVCRKRLLQSLFSKLESTLDQTLIKYELEK
ncbi:hypothetical protein LB504_006156 [Fusarium proliferatum]|nr:hypothetical protein LB504_006156 [Fusarium proliferatum]